MAGRGEGLHERGANAAVLLLVVMQPKRAPPALPPAKNGHV